jgi:pimeloyl-ACP methyl ester carboxylesterase
MSMKTREWGWGRPVVAMHPLGLESSAFEGVGRALSRRGFRTIAVDLPGFGETPLPEGPSTPAALAAPVVDLVRSLEQPAVVIGVSMGGRIALETALLAPEHVSAVVAIAPFLPWRRFRPMLDLAWLIHPRLAAAIPFERAWPALQLLSRTLERVPWLREDPMAQAGMRFVYYLSCPATRTGFIAAARELALDPALGPEGLWARLTQMTPPMAFVWGERDQLVPLDFTRPVARHAPGAMQMRLPCVGHWLNGPHHQCLADALAQILPALVDEGTVTEPVEQRDGVECVIGRCSVGAEASDPAIADAVTSGIAVDDR